MDQPHREQRERDERFARAWAEHQAVVADRTRPAVDPASGAGTLSALLGERARWLARPRRPAARHAVPNPSGGYLILLRFVGQAAV